MTTITDLRPRQRQLLELICRGWTDREIAAYLDLTPQAVRHRCMALYAALGVGGKGNPRVRAAVLWVGACCASARGSPHRCPPPAAG